MLRGALRREKGGIKRDFIVINIWITQLIILNERENKGIKQRHILLLGSAGYLGRTLMMYLQARNHVVPIHRSQARFADSRRYDFWMDDLYPLVEEHQIDTVVIAANMAYEEAHPVSGRASFEQRAERLVRACQQCRVIYISSDGLFDGKQGHYAESDVPVPMTL